MEVDRVACLTALTNLQATLKLISQTAADCWQSGERRPRRWVSADGSVFDFAGTLNECFRDNELGRVLRWVGFNIQDGPARRKRLIDVLRTMRDSIRWIESGNPNDPFLWARESIDAAAAAVPSELDHAHDYVGQLRQLIERLDGCSKPEFVPNDFQRSILDALEGRALKVDALADKVCGGDRTRLYKSGGLNELYEAGKVCNKPRLGCYRPDALPVAIGSAQNKVATK